jgi:hypothetical protein
MIMIIMVRDKLKLIETFSVTLIGSSFASNKRTGSGWISLAINTDTTCLIEIHGKNELSKSQKNKKIYRIFGST